jgi:hypothetical protein
MDRKFFRGRTDFKQNGQLGEFRAIFATLNIKDADGDVTLPGAFEEGQPVRISAWGHKWDQLPVGRGTIHANGKEAWVDGQFLLDTATGKEHYGTVKGMGDLQEWSYGFQVEDSIPGQFDGQDVRFLRKMRVIEVAPVMQGAGVDTRTADIKGDRNPYPDTKPYPNEHACRLRDPGDFQSESFRRTEREHEGKRYSVIMAWLKGETSMTEQAYRYPSDTWAEEQARKHCDSHDGATFEPATGKALKAGRVMAARNVERLRSALADLTEILKDAGLLETAASDSADDGDDTDQGKGRKATPRSSESSTLAARVAMELLEDE